MILLHKRIFVVDYNTDHLAAIAIYLGMHGAQVKYDRHGLQAHRTILRKLPIDLILMDLQFAHCVSGLTLFDEIRLIPELARIPIVALSASDPDAAMPLARLRGFGGYICKPVTNALGLQVAEVLGGHQVWGTDMFDAQAAHS